MKKKLTVHSRLLSTVLSKYSGTFSAFKELINNSIQAGAKEIQISLIPYPSEEVAYAYYKTIEVVDNGIGVSVHTFDDKILNIATDNKKGGKGIGRFAAFQIAKNISITTLAL
jgi:signal transduction histidine kinase